VTSADFTKYAPISGAATVAVAIGLDVSGLLDYAVWELALSFPLGAAIYLFIEFLSERVGA
jgi:hypothetical protein